MNNTATVFSKTLAFLSQSGGNCAADNTSSWSALLLWKPHPEDLKYARSCRLVLLAAAFIGIDTMSKDNLYRTISKIAARNRSEGDWSKVSEALLLDLIPYIQLEHYLKDRSLDDYFGNDIKLLNKVRRRFNVYNPYIERTSKVKIPQRKRGYDDKGHLRTDSLPAELRITREDYPAVDYHKDQSLEIAPEWYRKDNDEMQAGMVERASSIGQRKVIEEQDIRLGMKNKETKVEKEQPSRPSFQRSSIFDKKS